jgi:hypothetical protein
MRKRIFFSFKYFDHYDSNFIQLVFSDDLGEGENLLLCPDRLSSITRT